MAGRIDGERRGVDSPIPSPGNDDKRERSSQQTDCGSGASQSVYISRKVGSLLEGPLKAPPRSTPLMAGRSLGVPREATS